MSSKLEPNKPEQSKEKTVWPCSICPEMFRWRRHLDKHVEGHRKNACRLCDAPITTQKDLSLHMLQEHQVSIRNDKHACEHCERRFPRRRALFSHYQSCHADGKVICLDCGAFLDSEQELEQHAAAHSKDRPWKCQRCHASFSRRQQFTLHVETHDKYCCDVCGRSFVTKLSLTEHGRDFHGVATATHRCQHCDTSFERPCQLRRHQESHKEVDGVFTCVLKGGECCGRTFPTSRSLNKHRASVRHLEFVTPDNRKKFECGKCGQRFARKSSVARHVAPRRVHACDECDFKSHNAGSARRHRLLHSAPRGFVCDRCAAAFFSLTALNEHAAYRHSDRRHFTCSVCRLGFKTKSALTRHAQAHSDSRPHGCACGQRYKRASHLRRHQAAAHGPTSLSALPSRKVARRAETDVAVADPDPDPDLPDSRAAGPNDNHFTAWGKLRDQHNNDSERVHVEVVPDSSQPDLDLGHQSIGSSYKHIVHQTVADLEIHTPVKTPPIHNCDIDLTELNEGQNDMESSHCGMVEQVMAHHDLLQQAMEMAHRDMVSQGLGTPEQMLQDGYDFGATGLEFTTLQTVHKARDLTQLTEEDMAFSADTFLI